MLKSLAELNLTALTILLVNYSGQAVLAQVNMPEKEVPGKEKTVKTKILEKGAAILQSDTPINQLELYLDGFHYAQGNMNNQMEAHHYCHQVNEEVIQCALFDGNGKDAILIGVEHIISDRLYKTLPPDEQKMWHPHAYEVGSGMLIAPGLPNAAEHSLMAKIYTTHGKTWHVWDTSKNKLPIGQPMLMMGFTQDGQIKPALIKDRDKRLNVNTDEKRKSREDIPWKPVAENQK